MYTAPIPAILAVRGFDVTLRKTSFTKQPEELERIIARFLAAELECEVSVDYQVPF